MQSIGPYRILEEVARGGGGVVYRAQAPGGRLVALKLLSRSLSAMARKRLEREARALAQLEHPNLVGILDAGSEAGAPYLVLEWVPGDSVQAHLNKHGPFEPGRAVELALLLAGALQHVHDQGLLHRDLKPDNVLLNHEGEPMLADFGLVKDTESALSQLTQTGALQGTPGYWAPEQAAGELDRQGPATDLYGLGATLYAMLTGVPPVQGSGIAEILEATLHQVPAAPSRTQPAVGRELDAVCLRCLSKDPADRYASAAELARALEDAQHDSGRRGPTRAVRLLCWVALLALAGATLLGSRSQTAQARAALRDVETSPLSARALSMRARTRWWGEDDLEGALGDVEQALLLDPTLVSAYVLRAKLRMELGAFSDAMADYERALELQPTHAYAWNDRGYLKQTLGDATGALADYERAIELRPSFGMPYLNRGNVRYGRGDPRGALADYELAARSRLYRARALSNSAAARIDLGQLAEAVEDCDAALAIDVELPDAYLNRSVAKTRLDQLEGAMTDLDASLALNPDGLTALRNRAQLWGRLSDHAAALRDFDRALELDPEHPSTLVNRGLARKTLGDARGAVVDYSAAIALAPGIPEAWLNRGLAYEALGDEQRAVSDFEAFLRQAPEHRAADLARRALERLR